MTDLREQIAKSVYAGMQWACANNCGGKAPEWAEGGNSFAQDEARKQADAILELLKGAVKPLEWTGDKDAEVWAKAVTQIGTYFICDDTDDFSGFYLELISHDDARWWQHVRSTSEMIMDGHHDDDLSPLKAAAQADYSSRILAALGVK